jgi:hypothetical protein
LFRLAIFFSQLRFSLPRYGHFLSLAFALSLFLHFRWLLSFFDFSFLSLSFFRPHSSPFSSFHFHFISLALLSLISILFFFIAAARQRHVCRDAIACPPY